jgi:uncharacterized membrane protein (DUF2068 family)
MQNVTEKTSMATPNIQPPLLDEHRRHHFGLALIAVFKLVKGLLLLTAAIGLLKMIHKDVSATVEHWITVFRMDPDSHYFHWLLEKVGRISPQQLKAVSAGSFFYSGLLLTEGFGLWFERRWAEYLTVIATSSFIPLEVYELTRRVNDIKLWVLVINLAIVWYLIRTLRREHKSKS